MVNLLVTIGVTAGVTIVGGGLAYLIYLKTRPKKETWNAKIYQLQEGVRQPFVRDEKGKILIDKATKKPLLKPLKLQNLTPYARDVLEKVHKEPGITVYRLQKLHKTTPAPDAGCVEYWGEGRKEVTILKSQEGFTLLRKGYDKETGEVIFDPLSHSRINLIKQEMAIRKDRLHKEKDIIAAITPWVVAGILALSLVAIAYLLVNGFVSISQNLKDATDAYGENLIRLEVARQGIDLEEHPLGPQPPPGESNLTVEDYDTGTIRR